MPCSAGTYALMVGSRAAVLRTESAERGLESDGVDTPAVEGEVWAWGGGGMHVVKWCRGAPALAAFFEMCVELS
jgi:hypothetical protein